MPRADPEAAQISIHLEETWLPASDGTPLAAAIRRPAGSDSAPVPAILEIIPYRKRDLTRARDARLHGVFATAGYAGVRVDMRGSGDSGGVLTDEYLPGEQDDTLAVLHWLARQPWCTGDVGMIGISWGGFAGLQAAARQPPELKAVIAVGATDDRFADDVHQMGGCQLTENLSWAATMLDQMACPPDPALVGSAWRSMWQARLHGSGHWLTTWLQHQRRDAYWRHGSVCEAYSAIQCPVYAVSGWADGYTNAVFRLLANLPGPRKGLVGPWVHAYPDMATPGPAIGFAQEAVRWFDRWLKGRANGIDREPMLHLWLPDSAPPAAAPARRPGRWIAEATWPSARIGHRPYALAPGGSLVGDASTARAARLGLRSPVAAGLGGGKWCPYGTPPDQPHDQRWDDGGSLVFETGPLTEPLTICGQPTVRVDVAADRPVAQLCARLVDVRPDGAAARISYGLLNLTHRASHAEPAPLTPARLERVTVPLKHAAIRLPAGHSLRLSLSSSYWPVAWPAPKPVTLTIATGASVLDLPERAPGEADQPAIAFPEPALAPAPAETRFSPGEAGWRVDADLGRDVRTVAVTHDSGTVRLDALDLCLWQRVTERYSTTGEDPTSAVGWCQWQRQVQRGDWVVTTQTATRLTTDGTAFRLQATLDAYAGATRVAAESWDTTIPRDLV